MQINPLADKPIARDPVRITSHLVIATLVAALGGFLLGYDNLVISGTLDYLAKHFHLQALGTGFAASIAQLGGLVGALCGGWFADRLGLKRSLYACAFTFVVASVGIFYAPTIELYTCWRLICGLGSGAATIIAPMYVAEIAPAGVRGRLVTIFQLGLVFGIFFALLINSYIHGLGSEEWNVQTGWRWMFLVGALPGTLFFLAVLGAVESPRWLMKAGRENEAGSLLEKLDGPVRGAEIAGEIRASLAREEGRFSELFRTPFLRPLLIGVLLAAFSQTSGINVVLVYLPEIFKTSGLNANDAFSQSVLVSLVNIVFSFVALRLIDRAGRRTLIRLGTAIQFLALATIGVMYAGSATGIVLALAIMAVMAGHAVGNGVACWVVISEIFPTKLRGRAMSMAITAMWLASYLTLLVFPLMRNHLGDAATFWIFAAFALLNFFYACWQVPETRGYTLEEIEAMWRRSGKIDR
ncbi:MAG: sugar porter family MFS transporter [Verrucomicrobiales bacterium]|nr:sugar porter family MFS transporter [Verrucomicrobiales bacterium]